MTGLSVAVLAAGKGTRMRNARPKVLHDLAGFSLIGHVLRTADAIGADSLVAVLAPDAPEVEAEVRRLRPDAAIVHQEPALGTGHALQVALPALRAEGTVLVLYGDTPLMMPATLESLVARLRDEGAAVAVLGMRPPDPAGYGRLRLDGAGRLVALVEARDADADLLATAACNSGVMAIDAARLRPLLGGLALHAEKNEYYLTDIVALAVAQGWRCAAIEASWEEGHGVNSQAQLAEAMAILQVRLRAAHMENGVTLVAPETVHLAADAEIAPGVVIEPNVVLGPGVRVGEGARIHAFSHLEGAFVGPGVAVGPFARLRPGTVLEQGARVGNFVETKAATLKTGAKANHLTYLGDCEVGAGANVGAGTITCNYDGFSKHRTRIGDGAFIGSNAALVAPVEVGDGAVVGAGSVVVQDVPAGAVAIARGQQRNREGAAPLLRERLKVLRERLKGRTPPASG
ncbi:MAG: bifunctional UDP-N-acetylglucosamine diphosphorylase/glucosamine-1-phosphate N-acetyltransferase GlmU [Geminicoccaceae bacterium]|nr:bifunctional UDP-N-acetylglucosamine diphosphorylase/glucosamine-1-phosphate N-acetyltransferase GlmU [Geminicoccaceae bacterium]